MLERHNEEWNENEQSPSQAERRRQPRDCGGRPENRPLGIQDPPPPSKPPLHAGGDGHVPNGPTMNLPLGLGSPLPRVDDTAPGVAEVMQPDSDTACVTDPGPTTEATATCPSGGMPRTETALHGFSRNSFDTSRTSFGLTLRNTSPERTLG